MDEKALKNCNKITAVYALKFGKTQNIVVVAEVKTIFKIFVFIYEIFLKKLLQLPKHCVTIVKLIVGIGLLRPFRNIKICDDTIGGYALT